MDQYRHQTTGRTVTLPSPGSAYGIEVAGQIVGANTSAAAMAEMGYVPYSPPEPPAPTLPELQVAALARYYAEATARLDALTPAPWGRLADVVSAEYAAYIANIRTLVAAELYRIEAAIEAAKTPEALAAIVADWPEEEA